MKNHLYPDGIFCEKCGRVTRHHKLTNRRAQSCEFCGSGVYPTAGTIFHKSITPLTSWFYAVYLMSSTRCGVSAKQLQRELGVTYKTAWRMFHQIRKLLREDQGGPLSGSVEVDETYIGGRRHGKRGRGAEGKTAVSGVIEREGRVMAQLVPNVKAGTLMPIMREKVLPESTVYTDELARYQSTRRHCYQHHRVHHEVYVLGNAHTNTIENSWSQLKRPWTGRTTR